MGEEINDTKPRILVAEDDKENQRYLDFILRGTYEIDFCDSQDDFLCSFPTRSTILLLWI